MSNKEKELSVVRREVRFVTHIPETEENSDHHYVKETLTMSDGSTKPNVRLIENYRFPVFVTQERARNHFEKKEYESFDNLVMQRTTQSEFNLTAARMLGLEYLATNQKRLYESPYLYAGQVTGSNLIKLASLKRNDFLQSPYSVMAFDLEARPRTNELLVGSNVIEDTKKKKHYKIYCTLNRDWVKIHPDIEALVHAACERLIPEYNGRLDIEFQYSDTEVDMVRYLFRVANELAPDFMSIWNMDYDINTVILPLLKKHGLSPLDILCDQNLDRSLRRFSYIPGKEVKRTSSGKESPIHPADRWHKCDGTMRFRIVDSMCALRALRLHLKRLSSYALDNILQVFIKKSKLKIPKADRYKGEAWHVYMQENMIPEYIVYNFIDNIRLLELDDHTGDLSGSLPTYAEMADFNDFGSSDIKNLCAMYIFGMENQLVIGTGTDAEGYLERLSKDPRVPDQEVYLNRPMGIKNWIQTLAQGNTASGGLVLFYDFTSLETNARGGVSDIDSISSYPSCFIAGNVSKATCRSELIAVAGVPEVTFRAMNLGVVVGHTNTLEYCETMLGLPSVEQVIKMAQNNEI